eukprot:2389803-Rhodomonas_salina.2
MRARVERTVRLSAKEQEAADAPGRQCRRIPAGQEDQGALCTEHVSLNAVHAQRPLCVLAQPAVDRNAEGKALRSQPGGPSGPCGPGGPALPSRCLLLLEHAFFQSRQ